MLTSPRTHLLGATMVLHDRELRRSACGRYLDFEPLTFAAAGDLPSCSKCLFLADEVRREERR